MIKNTLSVIALSSLVMLSSCSKEEIEAKMNDAAAAAGASLDDLKGELADLDLSALSTDAIKEKAGTVTESLTSRLGEIKDKASAVEISESVEPLVGALGKMKDALGENMPSMESLSGVVESLKEKFAGNEGIMEALKPLLEKLQALFQ